MLSEYLHAEGVPPAWYALVWLQLLPFALMTLRLYLPARDGGVAAESVALSGTVLGACAVMILTSLWCAVLVARAAAPASAVRWISALVVHFVVWAFLGSAMVFAAFQALGAGSALRTRRLAAFGATAGALLFQAAILYATWYAWPR